MLIGIFNASQISSQCTPDGSIDSSLNNNSTDDKSPDLEKLKTYLKHQLIAYLNTNSLRNKIIVLREIMSYLSLD